jgi:hypothetical protein
MQKSQRVWSAVLMTTAVISLAAVFVIQLGSSLATPIITKAVALEPADVTSDLTPCGPDEYENMITAECEKGPPVNEEDAPTIQVASAGKSETSESSSEITSGPYPNCANATRAHPYNYENICAREVEARMVNIDIIVTEELTQSEIYFVQVPYLDIRDTGVMFQMYYSVRYGKSQWFPFSGMYSTAFHNGSLGLPIAEWVKNGLPIGTFLRVVLMTSSKNETSVKQ